MNGTGPGLPSGLSPGSSLSPCGVIELGKIGVPVGPGRIVDWGVGTYVGAIGVSKANGSIIEGRLQGLSDSQLRAWRTDAAGAVATSTKRGGREPTQEHCDPISPSAARISWTSSGLSRRDLSSKVTVESATARNHTNGPSVGCGLAGMVRQRNTLQSRYQRSSAKQCRSHVFKAQSKKSTWKKLTVDAPV